VFRRDQSSLTGNGAAAALQPPNKSTLLHPSDVQTCLALPGQTALVFGREESGLTEAELRLCAHSCAIPTGRIQGSMNLSHAVAVVLCGLFERRLQLLGLADLGIEVSGGLLLCSLGMEAGACVCQLEGCIATDTCCTHACCQYIYFKCDIVQRQLLLA
jgi:hypothetical protein